MKTLASEKQLLIAESELNRSQLLREMTALGDDVQEFSDRAKSFGAIASSAATIISGLAAFQQNAPAEPEAKPSRMNTLTKGAGLVSSLWQALRPRSRNER